MCISYSLIPLFNSSFSFTSDLNLYKVASRRIFQSPDVGSRVLSFILCPLCSTVTSNWMLATDEHVHLKISTDSLLKERWELTWFSDSFLFFALSDFVPLPMPSQCLLRTCIATVLIFYPSSMLWIPCATWMHSVQTHESTYCYHLFDLLLGEQTLFWFVVKEITRFA